MVRIKKKSRLLQIQSHYAAFTFQHFLPNTNRAAIRYPCWLEVQTLDINDSSLSCIANDHFAWGIILVVSTFTTPRDAVE